MDNRNKTLVNQSRRAGFGWLLMGWILCISLLTPGSLVAASQDEALLPRYDWHTFLGSADTDYGFDIAVDVEQNLVIVGASDESWDGPAGESPLHPHTGSSDLFVLKLDHNGAYLWHTFYGGSANDEGRQVAVDSLGNVYVAAFSHATWQGDGNTAPLVAFHGSIDASLVKLTKDGAYQWHAFYGVSVTEELGFGVALDSSDDPTFVMFNNGTWNGPSDQLPLHAFTAGGTNLSALKLSSAGAYQWHTFYPGTPALGLDYDPDDRLYLAASSEVDWTGPAGENPIHPRVGDKDLMLVKLNSSGAYLWHTFHGSGAGDFAYDIQTDSLGNPVVAGSCNQTWDGPAGEDPLNPFTGLFDFVALKLDSGGAYQWHAFYGSDADDFSLSLALDSADQVALVGHSAKAWEGPDSALPLYPYTGGMDLTVVSLTDAGDYRWHAFFGSSGTDNGESAAFDPEGNLFIVGGSKSTWRVNPQVPPLHEHSTGDFDLVLVKVDLTAEIYLPLVMR